MEEELVGHREFLFKILMVGEVSTGKTSLIKRYVHNIFNMHYKMTVGVDFALKVIKWDDNTMIRLQLWDIAGQERFSNMSRIYYKEAVGALVVFDVTRQNTLDGAIKWKSDIDSKITLSDTDQPIPVILLANKIDLFNANCEDDDNTWVKIRDNMDKLCETHRFKTWVETSAKNNIGIESAITKLVELVLANVKDQSNDTDHRDINLVDLDSDEESLTPKPDCC